ncbi:hypothetical protein LUZ60_014495 [Juncus effusus]|nr:hypothetical protein LUZ60_014495 [Juncus effusus]
MKRKSVMDPLGLVDVWNRELGLRSPRFFARRIGASEALIMRLGLYKTVNEHNGCVNTVSFNSDGRFLISGSDDKRVVLSDWDAGIVKLAFDSGHSNNVFQARFMPFSEDRSLVTCAADGEVRLAKILESGKVETALLGVHEGRAHKLAIEPGSPYIFYSCGEDGVVQHFDLRSKTATKLFTCKNDQDRVVNLNAIAIDPTEPYHFAVGGTDEYARMYDIRRHKWDGSTTTGRPSNTFCPAHLIGEDHLGITGLSFSHLGELLTSYNEENIYLFQKNQSLGPPSSLGSSNRDHSSNSPKMFEGHKNCDTVKGVSFLGPGCEYVASGSDCGRVFIWRRDGRLLRAMEGDKEVVNCIEGHPRMTVVASSGIDSDVKVWVPNLEEPVEYVDVNELKKQHKRRNRFCRFSIPEDLISQVLAMPRRRTNSGSNSNSNNNPELVNLIMGIASGDNSFDENRGEGLEGPGDCRVN